MKFSVGYQLCADDYFLENIIKRKDSISEVYFSWRNMPNGRNNQIKRIDMTENEAFYKQQRDLKIISDAGINLNILFNATCYGKNSQARDFFSEIGDTVDYLAENFKLTSVTTTSPLVASFIKKNFEELLVRASVNMGIGTIEGMEYVSEYFDSFYLKREYNRNFKVIKTLKKWCDENGKKLCILANSGCLNNCSAHTFHDNLVSHESEISQMDNGFDFKGICYDYLNKRNNLYKYLDVTGFIRPDDVCLYEEFFDCMKLATRVNANPVRILSSYIDLKSSSGNIMDLLEPNHSNAIYPYIVENSMIKSIVTDDELKYINLKNALIKLEEDIYAYQ